MAWILKARINSIAKARDYSIVESCQILAEDKLKGGNKMLGEAMYTTIETLLKQGLNKSQIAKATKHDWKTVDKVIKRISKGEPVLQSKPHPKILDKYREEVIQWVEQGLSGVRIHEKVQELGLGVAYSTVKEYCRGMRRKQDIFIRVHTQAGEEAQVDFGYVGLTPDNAGKRRKTWVFNMKLSYSRKDYYETVYNQTVETFIQCHINAFKYFGGVPKSVRIDNLKAAILEANFYEPVYQRAYKNFADYYEFTSIPCRIYRPNDKGKVESGIKYVKRNFFAGRTFKDKDDVDKRLFNWMDTKCNKRIHGTTRKVPDDIFDAEEKQELNPLPSEEFKLIKVGNRKVYHDCHVYIEYNYYSVPFEYVKKEVAIELSDSLVKIYYENKQVAVHQRMDGTGRFSTQESHYPKYKRYSDTEIQEKYQIKMAQIGQYAEQMFFYIKEHNPNNWTRPVAGILSLLKTYSQEVVNLSCKRALAFDVCTYKIIKNICADGIYNLPIDFNYGGFYASSQN